MWTALQLGFLLMMEGLEGIGLEADWDKLLQGLEPVLEWRASIT